MQQNKSIWKTLREYIVITLGLAGYVLGWTIFLVPNNLIGGGVTGIASILQYATHGTLKIGYTYFVVNAILLIVSMFTLGKGFGSKTVVAIIVASLSDDHPFRHLPDSGCRQRQADERHHGRHHGRNRYRNVHVGRGKYRGDGHHRADSQ